MNKRTIVIILVIVLLLCIPIGVKQCGGTDVEEDTLKNSSEYAAVISWPLQTEQLIFGDSIEIKIDVKDSKALEKMSLFIDEKAVLPDMTNKSQSYWYKASERVGKINIRLAMTQSGQTKGDNRTIEVFSDIVPQKKKATIVAEFKHESSSYTQGLEFFKGKLFEGTGDWGKSKLLEVDLKSGTVLRSIELGANEFGEGITIMDSTIYQLTYTSGKCFVYDMNFKFIKEFQYSGEGWGLCNNGKQILMTNGTDEIVWRDPSTFEITKKIQAFSDQQGYGSLNELELINGRLFANIYTKNSIIEIDTVTGKILSEIDCSALALKQPASVNYLNGIGYNPESDKIYVTGKLWPTLYEVIFE